MFLVKAMRHTFVVLVAAITILMIMPSLHAQADFVVPPLQNAVTLDGRFSNPSEWSDSLELSLESGVSGVVAYLNMKYDSNYLYLMWDFVECTKSFEGNSTVNYSNQVYFDMNPTNKATETLDSSMYSIVAFDAYQGAYYQRGTTAGGDWTDNALAGADVQVRSQFTISPRRSSSHLIVEMRMALTLGNVKSNMDHDIGFAIGFYDAYHDVGASSPRGWRDKDPSTWGTLQFSTEPIPEFPAALLPVLAVLVLIFVITKKRGWQMPTKA